MRVLIVATVICVILAFAHGFALANQTTISSTFDADLDGWAVYGWDNDFPPDGLGTGIWDASSGRTGGGIHFAGYGESDGTQNHLREGAFADKVISTAGLENIRLSYDLKTHIAAAYAIVPGDFALVDHGDLNQQLSVQYCTDGNNGVDGDWMELEWLRTNGLDIVHFGYMATWPLPPDPIPLQDYTTWTTRTIDLSWDSSANDNPAFALRLRWQFVTGCGDAQHGGCPANGGDWADIDNIRVTGDVIGTGADTTPPGPVTGFTATPENGYCHLAWTNPTDPDFAGVVLVVNGDHVPEHMDDGVALVDSWTHDPGATGSYDDIGRDPGRTYYYRIYTRDSVPNYNETEVSLLARMTDYLWFEAFDNYANGDLNSVSGGQWIPDPANAGQVTVTSTEALSPARSAQIENNSTAGSDGIVSHTGSYVGLDGLLQFHFNIKSPARDGNTFWHVDIEDNTGLFLGRVFGWEQQGAFVSGGSGSPNFVMSANTWHAIDVIVDTAANKTRFYMDGIYRFGATHIAGDSISKVRLWNERVGAANDGRRVYLDNVYITSPVHPRVTSPIGGEWLSTLTPTISWSRYGAGVIDSHQIRICTADDPEAPIYDSGTLPGNVTSFTLPTSLPENTHLWAFVRERADGNWNYWSPTGNGGFSVSVSVPGPPVITAPNGNSSSARPTVLFTGDSHASLEAKVTTDSAGNNAVWLSGQIASTEYSVQTGYLVPGTYHAFVRIGNMSGWSGWSAGSAFTVVALAPTDLDIRHMNEPNILIASSAPNDGFADKMPGFDEAGDFTVTVTSPNCGNSSLAIHDLWSAGGRRGLRKHRLSGVDLDKGVTIMTAVAITHQEGADGAGKNWRQSNIMIADYDDSISHVAGFKLHNDLVGIMTSDAAGNSEDNGLSWTVQSIPSSSEYRIIRITGRNSIPGNYSSTVWNLYIDEDPTAILTSTGNMNINNIEDTPSMRLAWQEDLICIGSGGTYLGQDLKFDWTAVNMTGDYVPGEWSPFGSGTYANVGAAKLATIEPHYVNITGPSVITRVSSHDEMQDSNLVSIRDGYYIQDLATVSDNPARNTTVSGVRVVTVDTQGGAASEGAKVTSISGVMVEQNGARTLVNPTVTIDGTADYAPMAASEKSLMGPCIDQGLGSRMDTTGMLVRIIGRCALSNFDPNGGTGLGAYIFYIDDGSGAIDGRDANAGELIGGIRFVVDARDWTFVAPTAGSYVMAEGIAGYEMANVPDPNNPGQTIPRIVRQLLVPTYTIVE